MGESRNNNFSVSCVACTQAKGHCLLEVCMTVRQLQCNSALQPPFCRTAFAPDSCLLPLLPRRRRAPPTATGWLRPLVGQPSCSPSRLWLVAATRQGPARTALMRRGKELMRRGRVLAVVPQG